MNRIRTLAADLQRCIGCLACEVACKQERNLAEGTAGIKVLTLGPYELNGELTMDFIPVSTNKCDLCSERAKQGKRPFCAEICPTQALSLYEAEALSWLLRGDRRIHMCKVMPELSRDSDRIRDIAGD
jgi:Fe-S-cluster-containing dehydrogenase component